jgi:putative NADPH-quinone reductase
MDGTSGITLERSRIEREHVVNILVVLAHPDPGSFNHALARAATQAARRRGHDVKLHDLYAERFDPILPSTEIPKAAEVPTWLKRHCEDLAAAEGIVVVHPNWWGQPPAILTGWIDRVVRAGVAYEFREGDQGEGVPVGLLHARTAVVLNTSNTPPGRERDVFGDPLDAIWRRCVFDLCGVKDVRRETYSVVVTSTDAQRSEWLSSASALVAEAFPGER